MSIIARVRKALVPLVPFVGSIVGYFAEHGHDERWLYAAGVSALTSAGVYAVKNTPKAVPAPTPINVVAHVVPAEDAPPEDDAARAAWDIAHTMVAA